MRRSMGRSFLILHGLANHRPPEHWQHWLAGRLRERGESVLYPALPEPDAPDPAEWERELLALLDRMIGGERVVVAHSLACLLWFRAAPQLAEEARVDRLLLVAPPACEDLPEGAARFRNQALDADAVRASVRDRIRIACSGSDPYNRAGARALYADPIGADLDTIQGAGHITPDTGYGPWPSLEEWCLRPEVVLRATGG
jgi:uncharacterized protein